MALLRRFDPPTFARALDDWSWLLGGRPLQPLGCSMFGDVFLQGPDAIWFLDSIEGTLTPQWHDTVALKAMLDSRDGQDRFLLAEIALAAQRKGLQPGPSEILDFTIPPAIGGQLSPNNVQVADFVVASSLNGQIHRQIKDLPPGTRISGAEIGD